MGKVEGSGEIQIEKKWSKISLTRILKFIRYDWCSSHTSRYLASMEDEEIKRWLLWWIKQKRRNKIWILKLLKQIQMDTKAGWEPYIHPTIYLSICLVMAQAAKENTGISVKNQSLNRQGITVLSMAFIMTEPHDCNDSQHSLHHYIKVLFSSWVMRLHWCLEPASYRREGIFLQALRCTIAIPNRIALAT